MASLSELYSVVEGAKADPPSDLFKRLCAAVIVVAGGIMQEPPETPNFHVRRSYAMTALLEPETMALRLLWRLLSEYSDLTISQINGATDAQILTSINSAFDELGLT